MNVSVTLRHRAFGFRININNKRSPWKLNRLPNSSRWIIYNEDTGERFMDTSFADKKGAVGFFRAKLNLTKDDTIKA